MKRDINAVVILLATQSMINLGEIQDPVTQEVHVDLENAKVFIDLIDVLEEKTRGNLSEEEGAFLKDVQANLRAVYDRKDSERE